MSPNKHNAAYNAILLYCDVNQVQGAATGQYVQAQITPASQCSLKLQYTVHIHVKVSHGLSVFAEGTGLMADRTMANDKQKYKYKLWQ
jgi:hypothetical protein